MESIKIESLNNLAQADNVKERAAEIQPGVVAHYREFHENPELGGEEFKTAEKIKEDLNDLGIEILQEGIGVAIDKEKGGTGIIARVKGKSGGPVIAFRADIDALPIEESQDHEPRSKNKGVMHACGHDVHTAGLLGAAKILKEQADRNELGGDVILLFQPSEEKTSQKESGAVQMVKQLEKLGLRDQIKAFFGVHIRADWPQGEFQINEGLQTFSSGELDIKLKSPGGHVMDSYEKPNLKEVSSILDQKLNAIFRKYYESGQALVNSTRTDYGGKGYNVLAPDSRETWVIRVGLPEYKKIALDIQEKIRQEVSAAVQEHLADINRTRDKLGKEALGSDKIQTEISVRLGYRPIVHRDPELVDLAKKAGQEIVGDNCRIFDHRDPSGEDFSFYLEALRGKQIPGVFLEMGAADAQAGFPPVNHHSPQFKVDPSALQDLVAVDCLVALKALEHFKNKS